MNAEQLSEGHAALDTWAIVEMFGHKRIAGRVSEHVIGSAALIRVDVPETQLDADTTSKAFTKLVGPGSIYCITPCTEEVARAAAQRFVRYDPPIPVEFQPRLPASVASDAEVVDGADEEESAFDGHSEEVDDEVDPENPIE